MSNQNFKRALLAALVAASVPTPATCEVTDSNVVMRYNDQDANIGGRVWLAGKDAGLFFDDLDENTNEVFIQQSHGGNLTPVVEVIIHRVSREEHEAAKSEIEAVVREYRIVDGEIVSEVLQLDEKDIVTEDKPDT